MDSNLLNATITISSVEDRGEQLIVKDENKKSWSFFKNKKTGGMTAAFTQFQNFKVGEAVGVGYKETPNPNGGVYRNIMTFQPPRYDREENARPMPKSMPTEHYEKPMEDREAYGRRLAIHGFVNGMLASGKYAGDITSEVISALIALENRIDIALAKNNVPIIHSDDIEAGNKAIENAQAEMVEGIDF